MNESLDRQSSYEITNNKITRSQTPEIHQTKPRDKNHTTDIQCVHDSNAVNYDFVSSSVVNHGDRGKMSLGARWGKKGSGSAGRPR